MERRESSERTAAKFLALYAKRRRRESSERTAAKFLALYAKRRRHEESTGRGTLGGWRKEECAAFRDVVLSHIGRLTPKLPHNLKREIEDDWGALTTRRLYRVLAEFIRAGIVRRVDDGYVLARARRAV